MATGGSNAAILKYVETFNSSMVPDVSKYDKLAKIGQGTFG